MFLKSEVQIGTLQIDVSIHGETKTGTLKRSRVRHIGGPKFDRCYPKTRPDAYQLGFLLRIFTWGVFQLPFFNQFMGFLTYQLLGFVPGTRHAMGWLPWLAISSALGFETLQFPEVRQSCWGIINSYHPIIHHCCQPVEKCFHLRGSCLGTWQDRFSDGCCWIYWQPCSQAVPRGRVSCLILDVLFMENEHLVAQHLNNGKKRSHSSNLGSCMNCIYNCQSG